MSLTLIIGPMKSSKSLDLITRVQPYVYAKKTISFVKPKRDVRGDNITSRLGVEAEAIEVDSLAEVQWAFDVIGVDEAHMFAPQDAQIISKWLREGKEVVISGLNTDHAGRLMPTIARLLELSPEILINKQAICEVCGDRATHTQVMNADGSVIAKSMPPEVPDDGTYRYEARCRRCFE